MTRATLLTPWGKLASHPPQASIASWFPLLDQTVTMYKDLLET